jgi:formate-dependent nitrite reductase complex subunit NrfG
MLLITFCFQYSLTKAISNPVRRYRTSASLSLLLVSLSGLIWLSLKSSPPKIEQPKALPSFEQLMDEKQNLLKNNPNSGKDWFALGEMYMQKNDFDSASTCFDYAIRLAKVPYASQFSALATALYYQQGQTITSDVQRLLHKTLELDPFNQTALQLVASDHFINGNYQQAIDVWTMILDSDRLGIDRVKLIQSINQAKGFVKN